jgi:hypothetical protein
MPAGNRYNPAETTNNISPFPRPSTGIISWIM